MTVTDALMLALGVIAVGSGALVVTSTHLVRAGFYLVVSLGAIAGLYLVLGAEMVAWVQVLVYVGAVVVLLLFAVMLTRAPIGPSRDLDRPALPAAIIGAGVGFGLAALLTDAFRWTEFELAPTGTAERVGTQVFGGWVLPFEVLSILLLAALVGAVVLSRPDVGARRGPGDSAAAPTEPHPGPVDETAEVVARLERIATRQAAAQARVRQAHAEKKAAEARAAAPVIEAEPEAEPPDPLRERARDIIFGAHEARPRVGRLDDLRPPPPEPLPVIEGEVEEDGPDEGRRALPSAGKPRPVPDGGKALPGPERPRRPGRRALPSAEKAGEKPGEKADEKPGEKNQEED